MREEWREGEVGEGGQVRRGEVRCAQVKKERGGRSKGREQWDGIPSNVYIHVNGDPSMRAKNRTSCDVRHNSSPRQCAVFPSKTLRGQISASF